jgi:AcrR family transcriptional regulator
MGTIATHKGGLKMGAKWRVWTLNDGQEVTIDQLVEETGVSKNTLYRRLKDGERDPKIVKRPTETVSSRGERLYTLDDGSQWTVKQLAGFLDCKKATAASRLQERLGLKVANVLKPVKSPSTYETDIFNDKELKERVALRMLEDKDKFWAIFNKGVNYGRNI